MELLIGFEFILLIFFGAMADSPNPTIAITGLIVCAIALAITATIKENMDARRPKHSTHSRLHRR